MVQLICGLQDFCSGIANMLGLRHPDNRNMTNTTCCVENTETWEEEKKFTVLNYSFLSILFKSDKSVMSVLFGINPYIYIYM